MTQRTGKASAKSSMTCGQRGDLRGRVPEEGETHVAPGESPAPRGTGPRDIRVPQDDACPCA